MSDKHLAALAHAAGLAVDWTGADGRLHRISPEVLRRVLDALGLPAESAAQIAESLAQLTRSDQATPLPPLLTLDLGQALDLSRHFAPGTPFELTLEDGSRPALPLATSACGSPIGSCAWPWRRRSAMACAS